jgi:hypothetical protein
VTDFADILREDFKAVPKAGDRERDLGDEVTLRLERCSDRDDFLEGELCRVQKTNVPPRAGPDGLMPIDLGGHGLGHVAAFLYHGPTRVLLLQRNMLSASPNRLALYLAATKAGRFFAFSPVMSVDAMERFKRKKPRSFSVTFAGPKNLAALDDDGLPAAKGAKLIAEAYEGVRVTIEVSVGKSRKLNLSKDQLLASLDKLMGVPGIKKLKVRAEDDGEDDLINFIKEQLHIDDKVKLVELDPDKNYEARSLFLRKAFSDNIPILRKMYG